MKKILFSILAIVTLSHITAANASEYTQDNPKLIKCNNCYSNYDYELIAKNNSIKNEYVYVLIFNENSEALRTYRVFEVYEPQDPYLNMTRAFLVSTDQKHVDNFQAYLEFKSSGEVIVNNLDSDYDPNVPHGIFSSVNRALREKYGPWYKLNVPNGSLILATAKNGYKLLLVKVTTIGLTSEQFEILLVEDEDGEIVDVLPTSNTDGSVSSGSGGYYFYSGSFGNYTICVSSDCGAPEGKVIIKEVEEE
ncbi:MAG TPA: hypothetical protein VIM93_07385 [Kangiella sp.]